MTFNKVMEWQGYRLDFNTKTYVMGILNVTPDSFSDGGKYGEESFAVKHALSMIETGADIIDVGGESTRPGASKVAEEEELRRVLDPIKAVSEVVQVPISIDTYKASVAEKAIQAGASIINDVWGAKADDNMAAVAAHYDVPIILTHNREKADYNNFIEDVIRDLEESISLCLNAGVSDSKIILDPGVGFAKTYEQNVLVMRHLEKISEMGYPVLLGTSRKSLIAKTLDLPVNERVEGTGATVCLGITKGTNIVRVHDVLEMSRMVKMMDVMIGKAQLPNV
ncbi:dihydropteroate synthase [Evansella cellulosilytica]|uniref:Dihydropteroate synthase n=1 Tax=Evansella cellulosilytica (strain ATCC 21833 / DSM 2522 / FERM P-1141 / JCM 9156 / N-4) TaxID=649639 RepID=E6TSF3_EVAC2|nr:dihydropteroate synthase [Evansella cellulosilytica]ADU28368.1 dihydropteroate synthase [Evansella cellulosilytica DSM 2522]